MATPGKESTGAYSFCYGEGQLPEGGGGDLFSSS